MSCLILFGVPNISCLSNMPRLQRIPFLDGLDVGIGRVQRVWTKDEWTIGTKRHEIATHSFLVKTCLRYHIKSHLVSLQNIVHIGELFARLVFVCANRFLNRRLAS